MEQGDKQDIYQFGLILLEVITGKPTDSQSELESLKAQVKHQLHCSHHYDESVLSIRSLKCCSFVMILS
jgi:hypothetical protein